MTAIIPKPEKLATVSGELHLTSPLTIFGGGETKQILDHFASSHERLFKFEASDQEAQVHLQLQADLRQDLGSEGYLLDISSEKVTIRAAQPAGLFYGMQTLRQLLPPEIQVSGYSLPCLSIRDRPRLSGGSRNDFPVSAPMATSRFSLSASGW